MMRYGWHFCWWLLGLPPLGAGAQARKAGDGLVGAYYDGHNFERKVLTRRDPAINFDWNQQSPAAGLAAEDFSVRWTGWLVPPTTGHYVLHLSVDDGIRLWLNGRELLNEWRGQPLSYYQLAVDLRAGEPYSLRIDYCQYSLSTRMRLAWEPPAVGPTPSNWRNLWGVTEETAGPVVIPTRYLFSQLPALVAAQPAAPPARPIPPVLLQSVKVSAPRQDAPTKAALLPKPPIATLKVRPRSYLALAATPAPPSAQPVPLAVPADSGRTTALAARLAAGQAVTLRALYFEQGHADLLPAVQASLDTLATALAQRPALRLEVQGHTDNQGDPAINHRLSRQRAEAVCQYLAGHGVGPARLRAVGYGGSRPVADNRLPDQRPRNRRVVLRPLR
jgi:outer membrane protein OmpA-like peptidoglycan-associated protein